MIVASPRRRVPLPLAAALRVLGIGLAGLVIGACSRGAPRADRAPWTDARTGIEWVPVGADYALSRSEITVAQWRRCVEGGACSAERVGGVQWKEKEWGLSEKCNWGGEGRETHPMNCVDWHDADAFCTWAGGRLMTKGEWHDEASESGRRIYPWGADEPTCEFAVMNDWMTHGGNFRQGCGERGTWPVCSKPRGHSAHGLCDVAGNVWEWTDTKEFPGPETEPRYNLGGSYANTPPYLEAEYTLVNPTKFRIDVLGLRCRIAL